MTQDFRIPKKQVTFTGRLLDYKDFLNHSSVFLETGSAVGDGIKRALDAGFKEVMSIEANEDYYLSCCERFINTKNVLLFLGRSTDMLNKIVFNSRQMVIFLDAHPSGPESFGHDDLMEKGSESEYQQHTIISMELKIILATYNRHIIIIDDINGLDTCAEQYMNQLLLANPDYKFFFYDENLSGDHLYKDKILVAIP